MNWDHGEVSQLEGCSFKLHQVSWDENPSEDFNGPSVCVSPKLDFCPHCFSKQNDLEVSPFNNQTSSDSSASCTHKVPRVNHLQPATLLATAKYPLNGHVCFNLELTFIETYWNILKKLVGKDFIDEHRWTYSSLFFLPGGYANFNFPPFWRKISCSWTSSTLEEIASFGCRLGLTEASENGDSTLNKYMITISYSSSYFWPNPCSSHFTSYVWWMNHAFFRFLPTFPACLLHGPPLPWLSGQIPAFIHGIDTAVGTAPSALAWQGLTMQRQVAGVNRTFEEFVQPRCFFWLILLYVWVTRSYYNYNYNNNNNKNIWMVPRELVHAFFGMFAQST